MPDVLGQLNSAAESRVASLDDAHAYIASTCFKTGPPRLVGVELEWLVHDADDDRLHVPAERLGAALGPWSPRTLRRSQTPFAPRLLPRGGVVTVEPGGQVEISSPPARGLSECIANSRTDLDNLRALTAAAGLRLVGSGVDADRPPRRILTVARYAAMQAYFDRFGPHGHAMMCSTASVQVSLDAGTAEPGPRSLRHRWQLLHALGPVMVAVFANSPIHNGRTTGWKSSRQQVWLGIDPARTAPPTGDDPVTAYTAYALNAPLLCQRRSELAWEAPAGVSFADWLAGASEPPPTYGDLDYHLTTLFPPGRACGHLEVRYLDAQGGDDWVVPVAVLSALVDGPEEVATEALEICSPVSGRWEQAAMHGLEDVEIHLAARECMALARSALSTMDVSFELTAYVDRFVKRHTDRGRSPADDQLDRMTGRPT